MIQKMPKLILLVAYTIQISASSKPFNSLQVAGPLTATGLTSVNGLNVKQGADFGGDVAADGTLFVDGNIVLDSCAVLTCDSGQLLVNGVPVNLGINCNAIPLTVPAGGATISSPGYYCLTGDTVGTITINSDDVTLDLNNHTLSPTSVNAIDVTGNRITIQNGTIAGSSNIGIFLGHASDIRIYDLNIDGAIIGVETLSTTTNLDIARTMVTTATTGFDIIGTSNVTLSECTASSGYGNGFAIFGASGSSVLLNSCVAADNVLYGFAIHGPNVAVTNCVAQGNSAGFLLNNIDIMLANCIANFNTFYGFEITGVNSTLTNCMAQGNGTNSSPGAGFFLVNSTTNIMLENCIASFNTGLGGFANFSTIFGNVSNFISCIAQNNMGDGFNLVNTSPQDGTGLIKSCIAQGNNGCGFNDAAGNTYQYVANVAEGNGESPATLSGDSNYCIGGAGQPIPTPPFNQYGPNISADTTAFTPTYWNNITLQ